MNFTEFAKSIKYKNVYSQFGEDGIIEAIFEKIGVANKWCFECGATDGVFMSNTRRLVEQGWQAVLVEADEKHFSRLLKLCDPDSGAVRSKLPHYEGFRYTSPQFALWCCKATTEGETSISAILKASYAPNDLDLMIIDVDGQDYHLFNTLLDYQPRVVICEFDPNADPDFIPTIGGQGQAGERAIHHVALARGYQVVCKTWCNLVCVRNDLCHLLGEEVEKRHPLDSLGAMIPVKEDAQPEPEPTPESSDVLFGGFTDQEYIEAKAKREQEGRFMFAACMSTPRWGPVSTMVTIQTALTAWNVPFFSTEGAYWHHHLTEAIEKGLRLHPDAIITFDYDSLFCPAPTENDIAKLVTLLVENPDVDVIAPLQLQREGGFLIANSDSGEFELTQPLTPVWFAHFGMTLFRASVFDRIKKPWFWEKPNEAGGWGEGRIDPDTGFWLNCKEAGIKVCVALDVVLGHGEYGPTFPDDQFRPIRMSGNEWRKNGMKPPANAFKRQRVIEAAMNGTYAGAKVDGKSTGPEPAVERLLARA